MTFRLDLANRANLFGNYASWHEDDNILDKSHISFTFSICYLINSLENIHKFKLESLQQFELFEADLKGKASEICFQSPSLFNLFSEISVSLSQMRIIQNILLEIVGKKLKRSFPSSMSDYATKSKNRTKCETEDAIYNLIAGYWGNNGLRVKQYRDVDQHHGQLFHNAVITKDDSTVNIELRLPDNPKEKNWNRFSYLRKVDAIAFIQESFSYLHDLINGVSRILGYDKVRFFDLNMNLSDDYENYLTVTFDPYQKCINGQEVMKEEGEIYCSTQTKKYNLDKFSFVKIPEYFKGKPMPKQYYMVGEKIKLGKEG